MDSTRNTSIQSTTDGGEKNYISSTFCQIYLVSYQELTARTMRLLIRMSRCTHGGHLHKLKLAQPRVLWLEQRLTLSSALRRKRQSTGIKSSVHPALSLSSPRPFVSVLPCGPLRCLSALCSHSPTGRARTLTHTPAAFASSSAASTPTPAGSVKTQTDAERGQTVPLEDVKRILQLAHPERWRLAGKLCAYVTNLWTGL